MRCRTLALLLLAGCASGPRLRATSSALEGRATEAKQRGAVQCAPREVALAEAHLDFAQTELELGRAGRAEEHLAVADENLRVAQELCAAKPPAAKPPEPKKAAPTDTDGDGVPEAIDRCPLDPEDRDGFQDEDGCPDPDDDGDGVVDAMDGCPHNPGPLENRGCPILDRDGDGIPDDQDRCPDEPGPAPDGCPKKYSMVELKEDRIEILQQIHFTTAKFRVLPDSFKLLDQVAQVLRDYPKMQVRIEGHTDNVGNAARNQKLSQRRAEAVRLYLVSRGIAGDRLSSIGFGMTRPVASNRTPRGRALNRRTEFHILDVK
jgi:outer membrane protein OmpA-like peptidoglycan-associated protein